MTTANVPAEQLRHDSDEGQPNASRYATVPDQDIQMLTPPNETHAAGAIEVRPTSALQKHPASERCPKMHGERDEFIKNIRANGILKPILITQEGVIIEGVHRWEVAKELNLETVPVRVVPTPANMEKAVYSMALAQKNLTLIERAPLMEFIHGEELRAVAKKALKKGGRGKKVGRNPSDLSEKEDNAVTTALANQMKCGTTKIKQIRYLNRHDSVIIPELGNIPVAQLVRQDEVSVDKGYHAVKKLLDNEELKKKINTPPPGVELTPVPDGYAVNQFLCCDVFNGMTKIAPGSVSLILTSPPYPVSGEKAEYPGWKYDGNYPKYLRWIGEVLREAFALLEPDGGRFAINIPRCSAQGRGTDQVLDVPGDIMRLMTKIGALRRFPVLWFKQNCNGNRNACGSYSDPTQQCNWEDILMFARGNHSRKHRQKNVEHPHSIHLQPDLFHKWTTGAWYLVPAYRKHTLHPCAFPAELARRVIMLNTCPGDTVADIFSGSGTTCWVAAGLNRQWIGIDNDDIQVKKSIDRMTTPYTVQDEEYTFPKKAEFQAQNNAVAPTPDDNAS